MTTLQKIIVFCNAMPLSMVSTDHPQGNLMPPSSGKTRSGVHTGSRLSEVSLDQEHRRNQSPYNYG